MSPRTRNRWRNNARYHLPHLVLGMGAGLLLLAVYGAGLVLAKVLT